MINYCNFFLLFNQFCCNKKKRIEPEPIAYNMDSKIYYEFLVKIRDCDIILSDSDLYYINSLPKDKLLEIINIYNLHMININNYLKNYD